MLRFCYFIFLVDYFRVCKKSDPNLGKCLNESLDLFRPYLKSGIPKVGLVSLDPLKFKKLSLFSNDRNKMIKGGLTWYLDNIQFVGTSNYYKTKSM